MKKIPKPHYSEHALYYENYINLIPEETSILDALKISGKQVLQAYKQMSETQLNFAYESGKWTPKDILQHLCDVERVFTYRAMRFARKDKSPQSFFDENEFVIQAQASKIPMSKLLKEYNTLRAATIGFFNTLNTVQLKEKGVAGNTPTSVRACAWIIYGHELHHMNVLRERYQQNIGK